MGLNSGFLSAHPMILMMSVVPAVLAAIVLSLSFRQPLSGLVERWRVPLIVLTYLVTRVALLIVVYVVLGDNKPQNDNAWWQWMGVGILEGKLPYRDFLCSHSPLFPYLMAVAFAIWRHDGAAVLIFGAFDVACLLLIYALAKRTANESVAKNAIWMWALNPAVWLITVRYAQDETIIAAVLMMASLLYLRGSKWWYGIVLALGFMITKFTTIPGLIVAFTYSNKKIRDALVGIVAVGLMLSMFTLQGIDITSPLRSEDMGIEGVNITVLIDRITQHSYVFAAHRVFSVIAMLAFGVTLVVCRRRKMSVLDAMCACVMVLLLFSPRSFKFYHLWAMGPLTVWCARNGKFGRYSLYSALICLFDDFSFHVGAPPALLAVMYSLAVAIITLEIWFVSDIMRKPEAKASVETPLQSDEQLASV